MYKFVLFKYESPKISFVPPEIFVYLLLPLNIYNVFNIFSSEQIRKRGTVLNHDTYLWVMLHQYGFQKFCSLFFDVNHFPL